MRYQLFIFAILLFACSPSDAVQEEDKFAQIEDQEAKAILKSAIAHAGGLERWNAIKHLRYTKDFRLLNEDGTVEKAYEQIHDYAYDPFYLDIISVENGDTVRTILRDGQYSRTVNKTRVDVTQEVLEQSMNTSTYVVSLPFKLLDPGSILKYLGEDTLSDGRVVDVIQVDYDADEHDNLSTSDIWRYYFDRPDRRIVANWVKTSDHFSLVENLTYERVGGVLFNKERKSYRIDSLGNKLYLRADYAYYNYEVE